MFTFPSGNGSNPLLPKRGAGLGFHGIGRLKPGVTIEQARADMQRSYGQTSRLHIRIPTRASEPRCFR